MCHALVTGAIKDTILEMEKEYEKEKPKKLVKKPRILVIGSKGREHAIVWKLAHSPLKPKLYCIPGNPGIRRYAECINANVESLNVLCDIAKDKRIDMVVVGSELPLSLGIVDVFKHTKIPVFGPNKKLASLESSKIFAKKFMNDYNIPTSKHKVFYDSDSAKDFIKGLSEPFVVKVDGLAGGKGVLVCDTVDDGMEAIDIIMIDKEFGTAGNGIVIEEFLEGVEISFMAFTDGKTVLPMTSSQDHKALENKDKGPNTGGMGAYSPVPLVTPELEKKIMDEIMIPTVNGIYNETGDLYKGVLYAGLMIVNGEPKVLEFNVRFGDPEAQVILTRLETDLIPVMKACIDGTLDEIKLEWKNKSSVCVVAASYGYPFDYERGFIIKGLNSITGEDVEIFHSETAIKNMKLVTSGGRVLGITALGEELSEAITNAYMAISEISFDGIYYRDDIGLKGLGYALS